MPFVDLQSRLGINLDQWILAQSGEQPYKRAARCHAFEKEWIECGHGIGQTRAKKECKLEFEDFYECMHRQKTPYVVHGCIGKKRLVENCCNGSRYGFKTRTAHWILGKLKRLYEIRKQKDKMMKEGSYTPPAHHTGNEELRP